MGLMIKWFQSTPAEEERSSVESKGRSRNIRGHLKLYRLFVSTSSMRICCSFCNPEPAETNIEEAMLEHRDIRLENHVLFQL